MKPSRSASLRLSARSAMRAESPGLLNEDTSLPPLPRLALSDPATLTALLPNDDEPEAEVTEVESREPAAAVDDEEPRLEVLIVYSVPSETVDGGRDVWRAVEVPERVGRGERPTNEADPSAGDERGEGVGRRAESDIGSTASESVTAGAPSRGELSALPFRLVVPGPSSAFTRLDRLDIPLLDITVDDCGSARDTRGDVAEPNPSSLCKAAAVDGSRDACPPA